MKTEYVIFTDKGSRPVNEDFADAAVKNGVSCFILCDGLGGHGMGDKASRFVVDFIKKQFLGCSTVSEFIKDIVDRTQNAIHDKQSELGLKGKMKTTCVILVIEKDRGICLHIGDSRLYQFRDGAVIFRTKDHSIPQMLVMTGEIDESEIRKHPDRNKVLRAFGDDHDTLKYDKSILEISNRDIFLLCSDGFWEPVTDSEMSALLSKSGTIKKWLSNMAKAVKNNSCGSSMDNYTAIAVEVKG